MVVRLRSDFAFSSLILLEFRLSWASSSLDSVTESWPDHGRLLALLDPILCLTTSIFCLICLTLLILELMADFFDAQAPVTSNSAASAIAAQAKTLLIRPIRISHSYFVV